MEMDGKKLEEFTRLLTGMKRHEWSKLKIAVERMYDRASCRLELNDAEAIQNSINCEFGRFNCSQQSVSSTGAGDNHGLDTEHE